MALNLPDHAHVGDPGHVEDTNLIIDALAELDSVKVEDLVIGTVTTGAPGTPAMADIHPGPGGTHTLDMTIPTGESGPHQVSADEGNIATIGSDNLILVPANMGVVEHGNLANLDADDHPQYLLPDEVLEGSGIVVDRTTIPGSVILSGTSVATDEVFTGAVPPGEPFEGQLWVDTSYPPPLVKVYDAGSWVDTGAVIPPPVLHAQASAPSGEYENTLLWLDTDDTSFSAAAGSATPAAAPARPTYVRNWDGLYYRISNGPLLLVLGPADPVPGGTAAGTVIVRRAS